MRQEISFQIIILERLFLFLRNIHQTEPRILKTQNLGFRTQNWERNGPHLGMIRTYHLEEVHRKKDDGIIMGLPSFRPSSLLLSVQFNM